MGGPLQVKYWGVRTPAALTPKYCLQQVITETSQNAGVHITALRKRNVPLPKQLAQFSSVINHYMYHSTIATYFQIKTKLPRICSDEVETELPY